MKISVPRAAVASLCALFVLFGSLFIRELGIQTDEALFAGAIYPPLSYDFSVRLFHHRIPLMVMTYVGAAKGWLYGLLFQIVDPSAISVRLPALLLGSLTIWLFFKLCARGIGVYGGVIAAALLATDPMYMLTTTWDWGPVVIQHLCIVSAVLLLAKYAENPKCRYLAAAFFILGTGLWDKALFAWSLIGLATSLVLVFPGQLRRHFRPKSVAFATLSFCIGSMPLLIYNMKHGWITFRGNTALSSDNFARKAKLVKETVEGAGLYGVVARDGWDGPVRAAETTISQILIRANEYAGSPRRSLQWYALVGAVLLVPLMSASVRRVFVFAFVFALVTWLLMAFTKNAGASTHHTILLWPAPPLLLAAGLVTFRRWPRGSILAAALAVLICISNIFVSTTYFSHQIRNGGAVAWSDSLYSLSAMLSSERPDEVCLLDWGFFDNLRLLQKGTLKLCTLAAPTTEDEHIALRSKLSQKKVFFISHTEGNEFFPEAAKRFTSALQSAGYGVRILRTIADRNGRPTINVFTVTLPVQ